MTTTKRKIQPTAKELDSYIAGREVGYESGVEAERKLVVAYLRGQAEEMRKMKFDEKAKLLDWCADDVERQHHVSCGRR